MENVSSTENTTIAPLKDKEEIRTKRVTPKSIAQQLAEFYQAEIKHEDADSVTLRKHGLDVCVHTTQEFEAAKEAVRQYIEGRRIQGARDGKIAGVGQF